MSQATSKQTGRRTPQSKPKQMGSVIDGSMVVSINTLDKSVADEFAEASKVIVASPKKDTKEAKVSKSPAEKAAASAPKEETKNEGVQNGSASEKKVENGKENGSEKKEEVKEGKEVKDLKEVTNGEGGKVRESPRQKAKEAEKKAAQVAKNDEEKQPAKNEEKSEVVEKKSDAKPELNASAASLAKEKELKGFKDNGEETLGSIVLQPEEVSGTLFDSPRPNKTPGKGLKGTTPNRARVSPFRKSERLQNVSTAVNLSTVSEQSGEVAQSPAVDQSFGSLRHITGRRSMTNRPLREYTFQSIHRESYRKLDDDSISSVNATVGSEIHCDSFRTPIVASVKGRKRELTPQDSDDDILIVDKTPAASKRARLDFSALLGFMASPVTLLRNKFQRANIQSSTPNQSFVVEELDNNGTEKEIDMECSKEEKSVEFGQELKEDLKVGPEGTGENLELLKDKVEDIEMKTPAQGRRVCIVM